MKELLSFSLLACIMNVTSFAQTTYYHASCITPIGCEANYTVFMEIGAQPEAAGVITVDWGDGNTTTHNYTTSTGLSINYVDVSHAYALGGTYPVSFNVYSGTAGANVGSNQDTVITAPGPGSCGFIEIYTNQPPSSGYANVPYKFTDVNNNVTILTPSMWTNDYVGLNPANAPYTVQIDPNWLLANNLAQTSPNITISSFDADGRASGSQYHVVNVTCSSQNPDFGLSYGWATNFVAPFETGTLKLKVCNYACNNTSNVSVSLLMPPNFIPTTTALTNPVVSGNTLTFDITSLSGCRQLTIPFTIPGTTPAGTDFCFDLTLNGANDSDLSNNWDTICGVVSNSFDPNDKSVDLPTNINPNVTDQLRYMIRFQNDGNHDAVNVVIRDSISEHLDLSTFQYLGAKHGVATSINPSTRVVTFTFENINLGQSSVDLEASQGYVVYSISELPNLPVGTEIENTAYIYFDFNPAIVTNTTYNINQIPLGLSENKNEQIVFYPNPAQNKLHLSGSAVQKVSIYDLAGKLVLEETQIANNELLLNGLQTGIYQVVLHTGNAISTQKLVIQK